MKRSIALFIFVVVFASMLVVGLVFRSGNAGLVPNMQAKEKGCTLDTLEGEYLFTGRADRAPGQPETNFPLVIAGVYTFDGAGNLSSFFTVSAGGNILRGQTITGTYTLESDCSGTLHFEDGRNFDLFVSRDGSEGNAIRTDNGTIVTRSFKKR